MEHMKSNEMEREKYNAVPPTGKGLLGVVGPLSSVGWKMICLSRLQPYH